MSLNTAGGRHAEYFAGIDGLRAIAVLGVLFFHLNGLIPSGFVGVDIFFVISGFVVASAAADLPAHRFRSFLAAFYARRVLRIFPALIVCLLATMTLMAAFIPVAPDGRLTEMNTKTGLAAFLGFSNVILSSSAGDYWSPRAELNPFTHTWSLGVEEQFYLVFPLVYFLWLKEKKRAAAVILGATIVASIIAAAVWTGKGTLAFYSLCSRFWELGCGVALYFSSRVWRPALAKRHYLHAPLGLAVASGLCVSLIRTDNQNFPWPWALLSVAVTVAAITLVVAAPQSPLSRLLGSRSLVSVGKISYSLYLWHWPIIVLGRWTIGLETWPELLGAILLTLMAAVCSYRFIEGPLRRAPAIRRLPRPLLLLSASGVLGVAIACAMGIAINRPFISMSVTADPLIWRWDGSLPVSASACRSTRTTSPMGTGKMLELHPVKCEPKTSHLYVAGDSHAGAYLAMLDLYARTTGTSVTIYTKPGCGVFPLRVTQASTSVDCQEFVSAVIEEIRVGAKAGDALFLPGLRIPRYMDQWGVDSRILAPSRDESPLDVIEEARSRLQSIADIGVRVIFEAPKPVFKAPPFRCSDSFNSANPICQAGFEVPRSDIEARRGPVLDRMRKIAELLPNASVWDPLPTLCTPRVCSAFDVRSGRPLFFDGDHVSGFGNERLSTAFSTAMDTRD